LKIGIYTVLQIVVAVHK